MTKAIHSAAAALAAAVFFAGCGTEVQTGPATNDFVLDPVSFATNVNPILDARGCTSSGCHNVFNGNGGRLLIFPNATVGSTEMDANFLAVSFFVSFSPSSASELLLEPLAGVQAPPVGSHTGGEIFATTGDVDYIAILDWINSATPAP
jgi:hypothetical protein